MVRMVLLSTRDARALNPERDGAGREARAGGGRGEGRTHSRAHGCWPPSNLVLPLACCCRQQVVIFTLISKLRVDKAIGKCKGAHQCVMLELSRTSSVVRWCNRVACHCTPSVA